MVFDPHLSNNYFSDLTFPCIIYHIIHILYTQNVLWTWNDWEKSRITSSGVSARFAISGNAPCHFYRDKKTSMGLTKIRFRNFTGTSTKSELFAHQIRNQVKICNNFGHKQNRESSQQGAGSRLPNHHP